MKANRPLLLILLLFSFVYAQSQSRKLYLQSGTIHTKANLTPAFIDSFNSVAAKQQAKSLVVLQFSSLPATSHRSLLTSGGIELLDYIPDNAYMAIISGPLDHSMLQNAGAVSLIPLEPEHKMESRLKGVLPAWASTIPGTVNLWISFTRAYSKEEVLAALAALQVDLVSVSMADYRILSVRISSARIRDLAAQPFVDFVQLAPRGDQTLNFNSRFGSRASLLNASVANGGKGLRGEGVVVGVGDNADVQTHIDFTGRLINRSPMPPSGHGHHVTGTVGGAGNGNDFYRGYAPKATIISQAFNGILRNAPAYVADYGMVITNNSYGDNVECGYHGTYDLYSRWMDQMAYDLPYLQNIFAAGNSGGSSCAPFLPGYHTVLGGYQSAKNILTVGATNDSAAISGFSSKGPVKDGRTKPEITAMGQFVASAWPTSYYSYNNGTSMASPAVAGGAALLYQRYRQLNGGLNPRNGLIKAVLCNGASDKGNNGPDYQYGFGWMNLLRSVEMLEKNWYLTGNASQGGLNNHTISVPANTAQLKVLLYWNDPAASPLAAKTLVNDLDLEVVSGTNTTLPRILDTANAGITTPSVEGVDRLNNMEQVLINNPAAGNYTLRVKGTALTQNPQQEYFLAYDIIPAGQLMITSPAGGEEWTPSVNNLSTMKISWEAYGFSTGTVRIEFSPDNGSNWITVASNININRLLYTWYVPNVSTVQARVRITKEDTGESTTSQPFSIFPLIVVSEAPVQCETYFNITWTAVPGATDYEVMVLRGTDMQGVGTTTSTSYSIGGLSVDTTYWVTVRPRINGVGGRRAVAIARKPVLGNCLGSISDHDLKIEFIVTPVSGRRFTSTQPAPASPVTVVVRNLDDAATTGFDLKYAINGGAWITETITTPVAPGGLYTHTFATPADLSAVGDYNLVVVVTNQSADPYPVNDTARKMVRHIDNQPLNLGTYFVDGMESAADVVYQKDTIGLWGLSRYDYARTSVFGRMRSFLNSGMANSGSKALTLDADSYQPAGNTNYLYGTYNLVNYNVTNHDLRLDFHYNNHGQLVHANNKVWIRGSDADPWITVYDLSAEQADPGIYKKTISIEMADILAANGQAFTPSFGVRWGQWGQTQATDKTNAAGYSIDDVRIYQVFNDLQMKSIDEPRISSCALGTASVIKVTIRNSANSTITNIPVKYRVNNGSWITETIPSIAANAELPYSFTGTSNLSALGSYVIQAVVDYSNDSFHENDTLETTIVNAPVITTFPHIQDFESGNGSWYSDGKNKSWAYGTPASSKIKGAASGARAWKTNLAGHYNDNEYSYLYSPCYDVSSLANPRLSFSVALDIEDCGTTLCDGAWVEYSADGLTWTKLGAAGSGTNWYNKTTHQLWSVQNYTYWHVASAALPAGLNRLRLRFVLRTDPAATREGIALDDIHIYDSAAIYDGPTLTAPLTATLSGNNWTHFSSGGKLVASVKAGNQTPGATEVQAFINTAPVRFTATQYYHDRNITIKPANSFTDSVTVRLYFLDKETDSLLKATGCPGCSKPSSAYQLGVSGYADPDDSFENGTIGDNNQGIWSFLSSDQVIKVPFDKGYYAEFKTAGQGEFWLNNGGLNGSTPLPIKMMEFTAQKSGADVLLTWKLGAETNIDRYEIELARGNDALQAGNWTKTGEVNSLGNTTVPRTYQFTDTEAGKTGTRYYRIKTVQLDGTFLYSPVRSVVYDDIQLWQVYPNPSTGLFQLFYQLNNQSKLNARLVDAKGRTVREYARTGSGQAEKLSLDLTLLASGVYLLEVNTEGKKQLFKLYKQ